MLDPLPYKPRHNKRKAGRLLGEHRRRVGDPNLGGSAMRAPLMTAYRQEALRCAELLACNGPMAPKAMRAVGDVPNAAKILRADHYGWFERVSRGIYALTPQGRVSLVHVRGEGPVGMKAREIKTLAKSGWHRCFVLLQRLGINVLPEHFYSAVPNLDDLGRPHRLAQAAEHVRHQPTRHRRPARPARRVDRTARRLPAAAIPCIERAIQGGGADGGYGEIEADVLFGFVATRRPRRVIQIGCGVSTAVMLMAAEKAGYKPEIVCIEPYPSACLREPRQRG